MLETRPLSFLYRKECSAKATPFLNSGNYSAGMSREGLTLDEDGSMDLNRSFAHINYFFEALTKVRVRNIVQEELGAKPVDFVAARVPEGVYLYSDSRHGALILSRIQHGELWLRYMPVCDSQFTLAEWAAGFPLHLFEDPELRVLEDRKEWLNEWHSEREWLEAIHRTRYSNGLIGLSDYFRPWEPPPGVPEIFRVADEPDWPVLQRFAAGAGGWCNPTCWSLHPITGNFNVRGLNPGGNHGIVLQNLDPFGFDVQRGWGCVGQKG